MNTLHNRSEEDYLETLLLICNEQGFAHRVEIAKRVGVSQVAVGKAFRALVEKGDVAEDGKHLTLTPKGRKRAEAVFERHCIIKEFLLSLGVSPDTAEEDACKMEHLLSDETFRLMKNSLAR